MSTFCKVCLLCSLGLSLFIFAMVNAKKDQRGDIKFCVSLGMQLAVTMCAIRITHGANALSNRSVRRWYRRFQAGATSVDDLPRSGRQSISTGPMLNNIQTILDQNPSISMSALAQQVGVSHGTAHKAVTKTLRMKK